MGKSVVVIASLFFLAARDTRAYTIGGRSSVQDSTLVARQDGTCAGNTNLNSCSGTKLPSNFCCPAGTSCMSLNNATSLVCCPTGQNCQVIAPITCDTTQQDATTFPGSLIKSTDTHSALESCGVACCPRGFSCQSGWCIAKNEDKSVSSPSSSLLSSASGSSTAATSTTTPVIIVPNTTTKQNSTPPPTTPAALGSSVTSTPNSSSYPAKAVVAGFFPGMIAGALLLFVVLLLLKWRQERDARRSGTFGRISATVSDPIYVKPQDTYRTDFLRRSSSTTSKPSMSNSSSGPSGFPGPDVSAFLSSGDRSPGKSDSPRRGPDALGRSHQDLPAIRTTASSPRASTVSIDVFADPSPLSLYPTGLRPPPADTRGSHMTATTTFGDMIAGAGRTDYSRKTRDNKNNNARDSVCSDPFIASPEPFRNPMPPPGNTCIPPLQYNLRLPPRTAKFPGGLRNS
ncbi:MAG: hypothetical protein M1813_001859 [Trichoglossum hirsutum]|nr:MAG: hypothetical protein M1813_001859 [Trichoglossum hirsutum]